MSSIHPLPPQVQGLIASRHELFDEYTKRQYLAKAPDKNPFGADEEPRRFADFDVFIKVCVAIIPPQSLFCDYKLTL